MSSAYTRVAVVQIAYHPAIVANLRSPIEDPLFDPKCGDSLLSLHGQVAHDSLQPELDGLRKRIRRVYCEQQIAKIRAILATCQEHSVRLVVFPEYSIPWDILDDVARAAGGMVIVAGTHTVDRAAKASGIYERLTAPKMPSLGQSVCPVLHDGRLLTLIPKLNPAEPERDSMKPGDAWAPVEMPDGIPGPMGVLICLDFLFDESNRYQTLVAPLMKTCQFLVVPSLTPHYTTSEFAGKAWDKARRYGRPVLYCDIANGGGTALYVDEGAPSDLRQFPERAGYLDSGDEGVIIADVNLGYDRAGPSTRYDSPKPVKPVAAATLVYQTDPAGHAYAQWLEEAAPHLKRDDEDALEQLVRRIERDRTLLLDACAMSGAKARDRRLRMLMNSIEKITNVEEIRRLTREVILPPEVVSFDIMRASLAKGAAEAVGAWLPEHPTLGNYVQQLRNASEVLEHASLTEAGRKTANAITANIHSTSAHTEGTRSPRTPDEVLALMASTGVLRLRIDSTELPSLFADRVNRLLKLSGVEIRNVVAVANVFRGDPYGLASRRVPDAVVAIDALGRAIVALGEDGYDPSAATRLPDVARALAPHGGVVRIYTEAIAEQIIDGVEYRSLKRSLLNLISDALRTRALICLEKWNENAERRFIDARAELDGNTLSVQTAIDTALGEQRCAFVTGNYGSGKSTHLRHYAKLLAEAYLCDPNSKPAPLLLPLSGHKPDLAQIIAARTPELDVEAFRLGVDLGLIVPIFDGIDELKIAPHEIVGALDALTGFSNSENARIILSSRNIVAFARDEFNASKQFARITLAEFNESEVENFVYKAVPSEQEAESTLERIRKVHDLQNLAGRPALLELIVEVREKLGEIEHLNSAELYRMVTERWIESRKERQDALTKQQRVGFAGALARVLAEGQQQDATFEDITQCVQRVRPGTRRLDPLLLDVQSAVFLDHNEHQDCYRFAHRSFGEYFLALDISERIDVGSERALDLPRLVPEVIVFLTEMTGWEQRVEYLRRLLATSYRRRESENALLCLYQWLRRKYGDDAAFGNALSHVIPERSKLNGCDLSRLSLPWLSLRKADLTGANLSFGDFSYSDFRDAVLDSARAEHTRFDGALMDRASFAGADLFATSFIDATTVGVQWESAYREGAIGIRTVVPEDETSATTPELISQLGGDVQAAAWSPDGRWLAVARRVGLALLNPLTGAVRWSIRAHAKDLTALSFSRDGNVIASGSSDGSVRLWNTCNGVLKETRSYNGKVRALHFLPNGDLEIAVVEAGKEVERDRVPVLGREYSIEIIARSPDGETVIEYDYGRTGLVFKSIRDGALTRSIEKLQTIIWSLAFSPDGRRIATAGTKGKVHIWDTDDGACKSEIDTSAEDVSDVAFSPDGRVLAIAPSYGNVEICDATTGAEIQCLEKFRMGVHTYIDFSPDGTILALAAAWCTILLWNRKTGVVHKIDLEDKAPVDGPFAMLRGAFSALEQITQQTKRMLRDVSDIKFSPTGEMFATASGDGVRIWNAATRQQVHLLEGRGIDTRQTYFRSVAFSPDGRLIAGGAGDGIIYLWDAESGQQNRAFQRHEDAVHAVAFSADGNHIVSGSYDGVLQLWDVSTSQCLWTQQAHQYWIAAVAFSPDGKRIASVSWDGTLRIWSVPDGRCLVTSMADEHGWISFAAGTPFYTCGGDPSRLVRVVSGARIMPLELWEPILRRPDLVAQALAGQPPDPAAHGLGSYSAAYEALVAERMRRGLVRRRETVGE